MMIRAIALALALGLAGCAGQQVPAPAVTVATVKVKEPCIAKVPERPAYETGRGQYPGDKAAAAILAKDFEKAEQYGTAWEAAAAGCIIVPASAGQ